MGMKGIGYDSVSDDYKVVVISSFDMYRGNMYVYNQGRLVNFGGPVPY